MTLHSMMHPNAYHRTRPTIKLPAGWTMQPIDNTGAPMTTRITFREEREFVVLGMFQDRGPYDHEAGVSLDLYDPQTKRSYQCFAHDSFFPPY